MNYTAKQIADYKLREELEELLLLHSDFMEAREIIVSKLLDNSYSCDSFSNWLGQTKHKNKQSLLQVLEEQGIVIAFGKSIFDLEECSK